MKYPIVINEILQGDALAVLKTLPGEFMDCCITSPPYWGLRDYGVEGQLGLEKTPEEFIVKMVDLFREVKRVLRNDGTLWLNIGDSYAAGGNGGGTEKQESNRGTRALKGKAKKAPSGMKPKDLVGIPWMLAFALRADGWYLRQDIIWSKPNPMPESVTDRCTKSHEYVFLLSKSKSYYFDNEAIKEKATTVNPIQRDAGWASGKDHSAVVWNTKDNRKKDGFRNGAAYINQKRNPSNHKKSFDPSQAGGGLNINGHSGARQPNGEPYQYAISGLRNKRSVWNIGTQAFSEAHFATFPEELIAPMILAGSRENGIVLDPFMGAGTTAIVAKKLARHYVGIDLNPEYIAIANKRIKKLGNPLFLKSPTIK